MALSCRKCKKIPKVYSTMYRCSKCTAPYHNTCLVLKIVSNKRVCPACYSKIKTNVSTKSVSDKSKVSTKSISDKSKDSISHDITKNKDDSESRNSDGTNVTIDTDDKDSISQDISKNKDDSVFKNSDVTNMTIDISSIKTTETLMTGVSSKKLLLNDSTAKVSTTPVTRTNTKKLLPDNYSAKSPETLTTGVNTKKVLTTSTPETNQSKPNISESNARNTSLAAVESTRYCTMPSSMLDLFEKQFELLTRTVDDHKSIILRKLDTISMNPPSTSTPDEVIDRLTTMVCSLEKKIDDQTSSLEVLHKTNSELLQKIEALNQKVDSLSSRTKNKEICKSRDIAGEIPCVEHEADASRVCVSLRDLVTGTDHSGQLHEEPSLPSQSLPSADTSRRPTYSRMVQNCSSRHTAGSSANGVSVIPSAWTEKKTHKKREVNKKTPKKSQSSSDDERTELIISGIVDCAKVGVDPVTVAHVILSTALPSIDRTEIISVRQAAPSAVRSINPKADNVNSSTAVEQCTVRPQPLIVRLANSSILGKVMQAKTTITRFNTSHLDLSRLGTDVTKNLCHTNIYINEALKPSNYSNFKSLKTVAKNLGFKFVWHRQGTFLARVREGLRAHTFYTASDLNTIMKSYSSKQEDKELDKMKDSEVISK